MKPVAVQRRADDQVAQVAKQASVGGAPVGQLPGQPLCFDWRDYGTCRRGGPGNGCTFYHGVPGTGKCRSLLMWAA